MRSAPEVTWSIMHPVRPEPGYMREVIAAAAEFHVDSFEICGDVHGSGGNLDGAIRFGDYPAAAAAVDAGAVAENVARLREVVALAHASQRPVYYWHREVMVPRPIVEAIPGLLDQNGEFDLLGEAYHTLVRAKLGEFFDAVPEMDGLVLTLTESDYSVIHNSDPRRYPPRQVVSRLLQTFAVELGHRGKRFILRSFGSVAQDYEDILAGAALMAPGWPLEIETKITPYDFSPFLPFNPFLRRTGHFALSAEYDSIGEFLGAGFLPAADPARAIACVAYARRQGVDRHVIRIDRIGHPTFASPQIVNLFAFDRAIRDPRTTAAAVWEGWAAGHWPACPAEMAAVMKRGIEVVKKTHFISGNVIFHAFPIHPELKWIKACGILSLFCPSRALQAHVGMWGILTGSRTPPRADLLREKDDAVATADEALADLERLRGRLPESEYVLAETNWRRATVVTRAIRAWCRAIAAYFDDMEQARADHARLTEAMAKGQGELRALASRALDGSASVDGAVPHAQPAHEYGDPASGADSVESAYLRPIWRHLELLPAEFDAEFRERAAWRARAGVVDFVVPGGLCDDIRVRRYMHASHACLLEGRPARYAGNRVFPNGFLKISLRRPANAASHLLVLGRAGAKFELAIGAQQAVAHCDASGEYRCPLVPPGLSGHPDLTVQIQKHGAEYPAIHGVGVIARAP